MKFHEHQPEIVEFWKQQTCHKISFNCWQFIQWLLYWQMTIFTYLNQVRSIIEELKQYYLSWEWLGIAIDNFGILVRFIRLDCRFGLHDVSVLINLPEINYDGVGWGRGAIKLWNVLCGIRGIVYKCAFLTDQDVHAHSLYE